LQKVTRKLANDAIVKRWFVVSWTFYFFDPWAFHGRASKKKDIATLCVAASAMVTHIWMLRQQSCQTQCLSHC
jgi:hypothetical protein